MNYSIAVFGAFDINSLGDMLFPKALEIEFKKRLVIRNITLFSPTNAQSEYNLGYEIYPYEEFEKIHAKNRFDAIIIGGGELLHYREINFTDIQGNAISYQNGWIWRYPVEMGKRFKIKTLINSVGMPHDISNEDKMLISSLDYISFRDKYSFCRFYGDAKIIDKNVVPDSLWNLDEYFPVLSDKHAVQYARKIIGLSENENYAALQLGTLDNWSNIFECVHKYCQENELKLVVFAINWCHDDRNVIKEMVKMTSSDCVIVDRLLKVEEIMTVIAGARLFVGTSLHGTLIGCLSGVRTVVYNMYSHFVSKMDGIAEWLECPNLLTDTVEQLDAALHNPPAEESPFSLSKIKKALADHFEQMSKVISGDHVNRQKTAVQLSGHSLNFDRSFFEWQKEGKLFWKTVISDSLSDVYWVDEHIEHTGQLLWKFRSLGFYILNVNSPDMAAINVGENGRCYDRIIQYRVTSDSTQLCFSYKKTTKEESDEFSELLQQYWNKTAHVELLEKSERAYINEINSKSAIIEKNCNFEQKLLMTEQALSNIVQSYNKEREETIAALYSENGALIKENNALKEVNAIELETNAQLKQELEEIEEEKIELHAQFKHELEEAEKENNRLKDAEKQYQSLVDTANKSAEELRQKLADMQQTIRNKEGHIELLLESERKYEREKNSRTYRLALVFRKISIFLLPINSKRRFFCKLLVKGVRHPIRMMRMITPRRIKNCFTILKTEGTESAANHLRLVEEFERSGSVDAARNKLDVAQVEEILEKPRTLDDYSPLLFTLPENPLVSIIIPVYNQFDYTYRCLESILKHSGDAVYEILLADDCSTDLTMNIGKAVTGIRIIRNQDNLRFLLNCNNAAKEARGKYILFLNNDTQVQEDWLRPLVDLMESDASVGMTGSKLIYSDGHLQEAGGIFWNDASAWNYGHMQNPEDPEYNYVKDADYISGASIMIRRSLWEEIGGFDECFAPAYYEDADLAFEVRKHGYRVVYQPLSAVVHFEGISNGTDLTAGQKKYQTINQQKFYDKWKDVLETEHFPNGENVFLAKDRSRRKKQILVVDHYVPHYDKDAGGKCTYMYLLLFVKMGFKVTFIGDNFYKHEPYTTDLNQHGIEVLYGNYYYNNWEQWLKDNLHYFDYVYLQRPHISIKYIDLVKQYGHAKIFYFAHDLHHIREYREYLLTHDEEKLKSSKHWKEIEYKLFEKADVGHVVGSYEQGIMQKAFPGKPVRNIPLYIYEELPENINKNFEERHDLVYVGGFGHPPNIDAVLWFGREVFPKILEKYPNMKWHVVGGKVPEDVQKLASKNIIIEGFLPDEKLHSLYRTCRMAVVPLRVGAGVKGKVVEAAYFQIPLVTTTVGAEGLDESMGNMAVEDEADKMAELICDLYRNYGRLCEMSDAGQVFIQKYFTIDEAERVLDLDIK